MDRKQDLETEEMTVSGHREREESKMSPRVRADEVGVIMALGGMRRLDRRFWEVEQEDQWGETRHFGLIK